MPRRRHRYSNRSAAATVPRRRVLLFPICRCRCATPPSKTVFGLPPPPCRTAQVLAAPVCRSRRAAPPNIISTQLPLLRRTCFVVPPRCAHCLLFYCCRCCCHCLVFVIPATWPRSSTGIPGIKSAASERKVASAYCNLDVALKSMGRLEEDVYNLERCLEMRQAIYRHDKVQGACRNCRFALPPRTCV